jgi:RNA polymerase sigma factor, sigma-70 family
MRDVVSKIEHGNRETFLKLVENISGTLYKIAYSYFRNSDRASDAVQDAILIAYKSISSLKEDGKFNSWITSILVNRCRDMLRRDKKIIFEEYTDAAVDYAHRQLDEYAKVDMNLDILNCMDQLDKKYRDVITLKYIGCYSIAEISNILNIPEGTVKSRLNSGLKKLKTIMEVDFGGMHSCVR